MTKELRSKVYNKFSQRCAYCGTDIKYKDMQVDHFQPKTIAHWFDKGYIDSLENLMPSCRRCNHYKRALLPEDWRKRMESLHNRLMESYINKVAIDFGIIEIKPFNGIFYFEKS